MERPHRNNIVFSAARNPEAIIAALAAFCLVYFSAPSIGLSPDSISYTSAARSLYATGSPHEFDGEWLVDFPLGYPAFLTLIMFISRLDPFQFGLVLNGILFAILVFVCLSQAKKNGFPLLLRYGYGLCLLFSTALLQVYGMLWSETLFILCTALFFATCGSYGRTHSTRALLAMAATTALACSTRYIGVTLLGVGILLLLTDRSFTGSTIPAAPDSPDPNSPIPPGSPVVPARRKKLLHISLYSAVSLSLLLFNLIINGLKAGHMAGDRLVNQTPFYQPLRRFGATLIHWLPVSEPPAALSVFCACL